MGILLLLVFACLGFVIGEFAPFTGAIAIRNRGIWQLSYTLVRIAEPFSPARNAAAIDYAIIAGFIGAIIGIALAPRKKDEKNKTFHYQFRLIPSIRLSPSP